jgi:hypothetical protein
MQKLSFVFAAGLALAAFGCKKSGGGGDCGKAIDHSMELSEAQMKKMPGIDDKVIQKMKDLGLKRCQEDKWSDEVTKCMADAKSEADSQECYKKLSPEQQQKMNKAAMEMMTSMQPAPTAAPAAPAAPAADTGSAAPAGSAAAAPAGSAGSAK